MAWEVRNLSPNDTRTTAASSDGSIRAEFVQPYRLKLYQGPHVLREVERVQYTGSAPWQIERVTGVGESSVYEITGAYGHAMSHHGGQFGKVWNRLFHDQDFRRFIQLGKESSELRAGIDTLVETLSKSTQKSAA